MEWFWNWLRDALGIPLAASWNSDSGTNSERIASFAAAYASQGLQGNLTSAQRQSAIAAATSALNLLNSNNSGVDASARQLGIVALEDILQELQS